MLALDQLVLVTTGDCHFCDYAHQVLDELGLEPREVDIGSVDADELAGRGIPLASLPVIGALVLTGLIYGEIGALVGVLLDKLAATYAILFLVAADLSVVQTPMFHSSPSRFAPLLPGYGPTRVMLEGAFAPSFKAGVPLLIALAWVLGLSAAAYLVLRRALGPAEPVPISVRSAIPRQGILKESR